MATILPEDIQEAIAFYTVDSKEENRFTQYVKRVKLYGGTRKEPKFLPSKRYVFPQGWRYVPSYDQSTSLSYNGTLTEQQSGVMNIIHKRQLEHNYGCGLIKLGTGKGKSHIIMKLACDMGVSTLVLVHNVKTLLEMSHKFYGFVSDKQGVQDNKYRVGLFYGKKKELAPITICTHTMFAAMGGNIGKHFDMIIVDECDHGLSSAFISALCESDAKFLYGLSGTVYRKNLYIQDMEKVYGKEIDVGGVAYEFSPKIEMIRWKSPKYEYETFADLKTAMVADDERIRAQCEVVSKLRKERGVVLILTERVEEAKRYKAELADAILITGETKEADDEGSLKAVYEGRGHVIIGTAGKMSRGVDVPPIDTVCMFAALHFRGSVIQAVGRCMRKFEGKKDVLIVDWSDTAIRTQAYGRKKSYVAEYGLDESLINKYDFKDYFGVRSEKLQDRKVVSSAVPEVSKGQLMLVT